MMSQTLGIARSSYYPSHHKTESKPSSENKKTIKQIIRIHQDSEGRYNASKIHQILFEQRLQISRKHVQLSMKKENIRSIILKKYKPHSSKSTVAGITYIHTQKDGWYYLASVMDLYS